MKGQVLMGPGTSPMQIRGLETFRPIFGGTVLHGRSAGGAEGIPGTYGCEAFGAHDSRRGCLVGHVVTNLGEVMTMAASWSADGKLVAMASTHSMGPPMVQRLLMQFDAQGALASAVSHSILGTAAPYESFRATCAKQP